MVGFCSLCICDVWAMTPVHHATLLGIVYIESKVLCVVVKSLI